MKVYKVDNCYYGDKENARILSEEIKMPVEEIQILDDKIDLPLVKSDKKFKVKSWNGKTYLVKIKDIFYGTAVVECLNDPSKSTNYAVKDIEEVIRENLWIPVSA